MREIDLLTIQSYQCYCLCLSWTHHLYGSRFNDLRYLGRLVWKFGIEFKNYNPWKNNSATQKICLRKNPLKTYFGKKYPKCIFIWTAILFKDIFVVLYEIRQSDAIIWCRK